MELPQKLALRPAQVGEAAQVQALYRSVLGTAGCVWDESYPTGENLQADLRSGGLFVLAGEEGVVGAVSVESDPELDDLPFWEDQSGGARELARVVIHPAWQGRGLAVGMLQELLSHLRAQGCSSVRLLAAVGNPAAVAVYRRLGFRFHGTCCRYELDFYACELLLMAQE